MRMGHFWVQNGPFAPNKHFLGKIIKIIFIYLLTNFTVPNFNFFTVDPELWGCVIFGPKMTQFAQTKIFPKNCLSWFLSVMPIYIPKMIFRYQSIIVILMIKEYWNLIGQGPFLAIITWEPDFSQVCSFSRILKDNKNFHFTTIPDKTKDLIFLKSTKNLVFWPFLTIFDITLFKKILLCHI